MNFSLNKAYKRDALINKWTDAQHQPTLGQCKLKPHCDTTLYQGGYDKKRDSNECWGGFEKQEFLFIAGENVTWGSHF